MLLCPPFGWDDVCSYRSRYAWSQALAEAGHPTVRIDLPGTGDTDGSPRTPGRLDAWTDAVSMAARWLRDETGCGRIAAIGLGLGGLVAYVALVRDAEIDDLALWAVPARGRALVRELRAFSLLERAAADALEPGPALPDHSALEVPGADDGSLEVGGFVMTAETVEALERVDLMKLALPDAARRRVLLLGRDDLAPDARLREHLERAGTAVSVADGRGYGLMMQDPRIARPPRQVFAQTISWLAATPSGSARSPADRGSYSAPRPRATLELMCGDEAVRETPFRVQVGAERLFGILSEPAAGQRAGATAVLFNAGSVRRIGPNRMWVEIARSWAARGVPTLRIDLSGVGDSDGDERPYLSTAAYYVPELTERAVAVLDALGSRGLPNRFILGGLCSGAYWSFACASQDERVIGALMINLWTFAWSDDLAAERALRNAGRLLRGDGPRDWTLRNVYEAGLRVIRTSLGRRRSRTRRARETRAVLDRLRDRRTELLLQFSADEALYDDLARDRILDDLDRWPNLRLERIPGHDHTFRALRSQSQLRRDFDEALGRVLAGIGESGPSRGEI